MMFQQELLGGQSRLTAMYISAILKQDRTMILYIMTEARTHLKGHILRFPEHLMGAADICMSQKI